MVHIELSHEQKVEQARARVKTAYDLMMNTESTSPLMVGRIEKWKERKKELAVLLTPKIAYNE